MTMTRTTKRRRGQALVEFALVALALYLLIAAVLTFGHMLHQAQVAQEAADICAKELARLPLPADSMTLRDVLLYANPYDEGSYSVETRSTILRVRREVFDEQFLVLDPAQLAAAGWTLQEAIDRLPIVNQQLVPAMTADVVLGRRVLRLPGAVFVDNDPSNDPREVDMPPASGLLVRIPLIVARPTRDSMQIDWVPLIDEIAAQQDPDPFKISSPQRGIVGIRVNIPYGSPAMTSFEPVEPTPDDPFPPSIGRPHVADDELVTVVDNDGYTPSGTPTISDRVYGPYAGEYGLGRQAALGSQTLTGGRPVRPYSRTIVGQSIHRREIFGQ